jgi:hypothetical protein
MVALVLGRPVMMETWSLEMAVAPIVSMRDPIRWLPCVEMVRVSQGSPARRILTVLGHVDVIM